MQSKSGHRVIKKRSPFLVVQKTGVKSLDQPGLLGSVIRGGNQKWSVAPNSELCAGYLMKFSVFF